MLLHPIALSPIVEGLLSRGLTGCSGSILLKNSKMISLHFPAKLNRDRQFGL
jgi:hypothetical protein